MSEGNETYVATLTVFTRVSADYDVAKRTRSKTLQSSCTIKEIMDWVAVQEQGSMGSSDVIITRDK